jgi:hypothetical protein
LLVVATVTVALLLVVPPDPVQLNVYTVVAEREPVDCEPLTACAPLHPAEAVQEVALAELHVNVEALPLFTLVGPAVSETVGAAGACTVTVVDCDVEPPLPEQVSVNFVVVVRAAVVCEPVLAIEPVQPPEAVHEVALVDDQTKDDVAPLFTVTGFAVMVTVGAALVTDTVAD